ncbi:hypothetical protein QWY77_10680 [Thalassotalea ponticola]|uniref:hypothetical protein n=1 Tax=Thalassotalea ponticola TaxID=1523392 RepID=UPI0025B530B0|nr:hypothetical protein [Thalassotalea ponticola]MDN3653216.1 hypothetical protein [Thalassotalea ponticola]
MAKPNKKLPQRTVSVQCQQCKAILYKYKKGGKGSLIKCFKERIVEDFTEQPGVCPKCVTQFARETLVRGTPAFKIIGNKAICK